MNPPGVIDAQLHAGDGRDVDAHLGLMAAAGVKAAVLVQTVAQGYDNVFLLETAAAFSGTFAVVGVLDPFSPEVEEDVAAFRETPFVLGARIVALSAERLGWLRTGGYDRFVAAAERVELPVFVYAPRNLDLVEALAERHPGLLVVLDHIGLPQPPVLAAGEDPWTDFAHVLRLSRLPNVALKCTALPTLSRSAYPFVDLWPIPAPAHRGVWTRAPDVGDGHHARRDRAHLRRCARLSTRDGRARPEREGAASRRHAPCSIRVGSSAGARGGGARMTSSSAEWRLVAPVGQRLDSEGGSELAAIDGTLRFAFLSNHKPNAELIQRRVADSVRERYGSRIAIEHYEKPNMALPAPTDVLRSIAERASLLVAGSGD